MQVRYRPPRSSCHCIHVYVLLFQSVRGLDVVDALREAGDANSARLESIKDSMSQIARDVSIISQDVSSISNQAQVAIQMKNLIIFCAE